VGSPGMMGVGVPLGRSVTGHVTVGSPRAEGGGGDLDLSQEVGGKEPYRDQRPITKVSEVFTPTTPYLHFQAPCQSIAMRLG
jgi:hypothetical protein